jgi:CRP-like cAMP-binding protein
MVGFLDQLDNRHALSPELRDHLQHIAQFAEWPPGKRLLKPGQTCQRIGWAEYGLLRLYHVDKGREVTTAFMKEKDWVVSAASFFRQAPARENIEVLERMGLWSITYHQLQECYDRFPDFNAVARRILEKYYVALEKRLHTLQGKKAQDRWEIFNKCHPDLLARAPVKHIASYLGMAGETLSRLRSA